jgi:fucose permease
LPLRPSALLILAYVGFISLGLPDGVNGVAWPSVRHAFSAGSGALGFISLSLGTGYVLSSLFSGSLVGRLGVGRVLAGSTALAAAGLAVHAVAGRWIPFVTGAVLVGLGSGAVDAALNAFVARTYAAKHVNWLHACYSIGATLGPILMAAAIHRIGSWRLGYGAVAILLAALGAGFLATIGGWGPRAPAPHRPIGAMTDALRHPLARLHLVAFFTYTGLEALLGQWAYTVLREFRRVPEDAAAAWTASYFGAIAAGRVLTGFAVGRFGTDRTARVGTWGAAAGVALFAFGHRDAVFGPGLVMAGLALAPVFPCLMSRTPARVGEALAPHAIGYQVSLATVGAAVLPALGGALVAAQGLAAVSMEAIGLSVLLVLLHEALLARASKAGIPPG